MPVDVQRPWVASLLTVAASVFLIGVGGVLLVDPDLGGQLFGQDRTVEKGGFERATGIRMAYLGALVLALWWTGRRREVALVLIGLAVIPLSDSLIWLNAGSGLVKASEHLLGLLIPAAGAFILHDERRRASAANRPGGRTR
jgi:Domain of unknown function (DUF4267)